MLSRTQASRNLRFVETRAVCSADLTSFVWKRGVMKSKTGGAAVRRRKTVCPSWGMSILMIVDTKLPERRRDRMAHRLRLEIKPEEVPVLFLARPTVSSRSGVPPRRSPGYLITTFDPTNS